MRLILLGGIRLLLGAHGVAELAVRNTPLITYCR